MHLIIVEKTLNDHYMVVRLGSLTSIITTRMKFLREDMKRLGLDIENREGFHLTETD